MVSLSPQSSGSGTSLVVPGENNVTSSEIGSTRLHRHEFFPTPNAEADFAVWFY